MREHRWPDRLAVLPVLLLCSTAALAAPKIGSVVQREFNGAAGTRADAALAEDLPYTHEVFAGEKVNTPDKGSTVLRFRDQSQLQIGANSTVVLDRFIYDPNAQAMTGTITL